MTSRNSFCKISIMRPILGRNLWVVALSILGFLFALPLPVAMLIQNASKRAADGMDMQYYNPRIMSVMNADNFAVKFGIAIMAVLCGVALFRYLHSSRQVDLYHALPIRRECLFTLNYVSGVLLVLPVYLVMHLLAILVAVSLGYGYLMVWSQIFSFILTNCVFFLLIYTISVLCTVLTGNTVLAVLLDGWALFSAPAILFLVEGYKSSFFRTYAEPSSTVSLLISRLSPVVHYFSFEKFAKLSPATGGSGGWMDTFAVNILCAVLATAVIAAVACLLFRLRPSESAGTAVAFGHFRLPLKIYMTLVASLGLGLMLHSSLNEFWMIFGLIAGAFILHCIIEIIYHFDFKAIFKHLPTMAIICAVSVLSVMGIKLDMLGFDRYVPSPDKVQACDIDIYNVQTSGTAYAQSGGLYNTNKTDLVDRKNIDRIIRLAEIGCENIEKYPEDAVLENYSITYRLTSGKLVSRNYTVQVSDEISGLLDEIRFTEEYRKRSPLYEDMDINRVSMTLVNGTQTSKTMDGKTYPNETAALLQAIRKDSLTLTSEEAASMPPAFALTIKLADANGDPYTFENRIDNYPIYASYTNTLELIQKYLGLVPEKLQAEQVNQITLEYSETFAKYPEKYGYDMPMEEGNWQTYRVEDRLDIAVLMENAIPQDLWYACDASLVADNRTATADVVTGEGTLVNRVSLYYQQKNYPEQILQKYRNK